MAKWSAKSLEPPASNDTNNHLDVEDIARLVEGSVEGAESECLFHHVNRCQRCYELLDNTLKDVQPAASGHRAAETRRRRKVIYALAAAIILIFVISGQLAYKYWIRDTGIISATIELDPVLKDILLEDTELRIEKAARLERLLAALQQKGLAVRHLKLAILSKPYYQKKSLFGPEEVLHIRIENEVAYLEVKEREAD